MGKLKIGMYGRLYSGDIVKILEVYDKVEPIHYKTDINKAVRTWERDFVLWGYKKIDVIKEGDYVNGYKVTGKDNFSIGINLLNEYEQNWEWLCEDEIQTIVTKERFEKMAYKVGD